MKKFISIAIVLSIIFCFASCSSSGSIKYIKVTDSKWYPITESYLDPAIQVRFDVENTGDKTVLEYAVKMELYDEDGKYLTSFTADSTHSLAPGETEDGNIHLEPEGINVNDVDDVKLTIIDEVVE